MQKIIFTIFNVTGLVAIYLFYINRLVNCDSLVVAAEKYIFKQQIYFENLKNFWYILLYSLSKKLILIFGNKLVFKIFGGFYYRMPKPTKLLLKIIAKF